MAAGRCLYGVLAITHDDLALITATKRPFSHPDWLFELKYDGFRVLVLKEGGGVRLLSRHGRDMTEAFPELVEQVRGLRGDVAIDGELVSLDQMGRPQFEPLCARAWTRDPTQIKLASRAQPGTIFCFDLLYARGQDHRQLPLVVRKAALRRLLRGGDRVRLAQHIEREGEALYQHVEKMELEGIVAKRASSIYVRGRCKGWLKIKTPAGKAREALRMEHRFR